MEDKTCTICIEDFTENTFINELNCKHIFHIDCIKDWIQVKSQDEVKCPNCNKKIYSNNEEIDQPLLV